jgi:hypothetical protein
VKKKRTGKETGDFFHGFRRFFWLFVLNRVCTVFGVVARRLSAYPAEEPA